jgi:hypothetical protein
MKAKCLRMQKFPEQILPCAFLPFYGQISGGNIAFEIFLKLSYKNCSGNFG